MLKMRLSLFKLRRMIAEELTHAGVTTLSEGSKKMNPGDATKKVAAFIDKKLERNDYNEKCRYGNRFYSSYAAKYGGQDALIIASNDNSYPVITAEGAFLNKDDMVKAIEEAVSQTETTGIVTPSLLTTVSRDDSLLTYFNSETQAFEKLSRRNFAQNVYLSILGPGSGD
jgi:hypothetical protein